MWQFVVPTNVVLGISQTTCPIHFGEKDQGPVPGLDFQVGMECNRPESQWSVASTIHLQLDTDTGNRQGETWHQVFLGLLCSKSEDVHINVNLEHGRWRWKGWPTRTLKTLGVYNGWWSSQLGPTKLRWKPKNTQSPQQTSHSICHDQFHLALAINPMFVYNICPGKNI